MYLSKSVAVSFGGCGNNNLLPPVPTIEVFQVFLDGAQSGKFSGKVNRCDTGVVGVPVQLFLQSLVDLIQRAQKELKGKKHKAMRPWSQGGPFDPEKKHTTTQ